MIFYADESSFLLNPKFHSTYAPKGQPPIVHTWNKSFQYVSVCGAISHQGDFVYTTNDSAYTGDKIVAFLQKLLKQFSQKIILIWDGASIHSCQLVRQFLDTLPKGRLKLVRQPSYSPELNASEQIWNYAKNVDLKDRVFKKVKNLKIAIKSTFEKFKQRQELIKSFFSQSDVAFY